MSASAGGGSGAATSASSGNVKQLPRDAMVMHSLLKEMGVTLHEPRVVNQMLDFVYRYVTNVVEEARAYSSYAKKKTIDGDDVKLAVNMTTTKSFTTVPPREMLLEVARNKNSQPLPLLKSNSGLRLPPDRFCLTQPNYHLEFYKKAIASSMSNPATTSVRLPGTVAVFKTPQNPHRVLSGGSHPHIIQYSPMSSGAAKPVVTMLAAGQQVTGVKRKLSDDDAWTTP